MSSQVRISEDGIAQLSNSTPYDRIYAIPELNLPSLRKRRHSAGSSIISPSEKLGSLGVPLGESCFVTRTFNYALANAHLITPPKDGKAKAAIERFLERCHVVLPGFTLDSAANIIKLDRNVHYCLDKLRFIAITCTKATLQAMLKVVEAENKKYDELGGRYFRLFEFSKAPFSNAEYELVLLHPDHFLPRRSSINMYFEGPSDSITCKLYMVGEDGALREGRETTSPRFPAFSPSNLRAEEHRINPLLVVLSAQASFRRFRTLREQITEKLYPEYAELVDLTIQLADAILHPPIYQRAGGVNFVQVPKQTEDDDAQVAG